MELSCHCGAAKLTLARPPRTITDCNCSICRRLGARWAYFRRSEVVAPEPGTTDTYCQGARTLAFHRCRICGCLTHWESVKKGADERIGVNVRLADPAAVADVPVRRFDGASTWTYLD